MSTRRGSRVEVAEAGGDRREGVQRLAEGVEAQRLHVELEVGVVLARRRAGEGAELARRRAHRPGPPQRVLERDPRLAAPAGAELVSVPPAVTFQTSGAAGGPAGCRRPPAGRRPHRCRARAAAPRPEPGELQQLRAVHRPAASTTARRAAIRRRRRARPRCSRGPSPALDHEPRHLGPGPHHEVRAGRSPGARKARAAFQRKPARWLTSK